MIRGVRLHNFKGFRRFQITLGKRAVLVGPNNAGKSTAISAIRAVAGMRRRATRENPRLYVHDGNRAMRGWSLPLGYGLDEENLRYDFLPVPVRLEARFDTGARLTALWPGKSDESDNDEDHPDPFFYMTTKDGMPIASTTAVRASAPDIGIVPILMPIDLHEVSRSRDTVVRNLSGRLASRHFRNQLYLLTLDEAEDGDGTIFDQFIRFAEPWLVGTQLEPPTLRPVERGVEIDVYYYENRRPRELAWSGDGFQVFLQLLYHVFRLRDAATLVLDEPDVYLHPDLQRRFFQVVDAHPGQVIFASHSSELVAEAPPKAVIWIDRARTTAVSSPDPQTLEDLSIAIGSGFNLRLAQVLRAKCVLFVEGDDMAILRVIARTLGLTELVSGRHLATVPLGGAANRARLESFGWVVNELLKGAVNGFVLLDRDYRPADVVTRISGQMRAYGLEPHVWRRKEIESYLLESTTLSRVIGAPIEWVDDVLAKETDRLRNFVLSRMTGAMHEDRLDRKLDVTTVAERCGAELDGFWPDPLARRWRAPAKNLISAVNRAAQAAGHSTVDARSLAVNIRFDELADEMRHALTEINDAAS